MSSMKEMYEEQQAHLMSLLDTNPLEAIKLAQAMLLEDYEDQYVKLNMIGLCAVIFIDGGTATQHREVIKRGVELLSGIYIRYPTANIAYNLANGLVAISGFPPNDHTWLDHQEHTRHERAKARQYFWQAAKETELEGELRTQAWTNLARQFSNSYRLSEAHDSWLEALKIDPTNGVAANSAARNLLWLYERNNASDLSLVEAVILAKRAIQHHETNIKYAGLEAAKQILVSSNQIVSLANKIDETTTRSPHTDLFMQWLENERLTLSPTVELIDPTFNKLDWLTLPGILVNIGENEGSPPPIFAMFNMLKSDFILIRDLAWRAIGDKALPSTGQFADTLDYALYGPEISALILAHRTALDLLDKVAVTANQYFKLGQAPDKVYFDGLWRKKQHKKTDVHPLTEEVEKIIRSGVPALYGLVELADDYQNSEGILRSQKNLRNVGTHRFLVLHDFGDISKIMNSQEIEHQKYYVFTQEVLRALRVARSAIQMLAFAIGQHEEQLRKQTKGLISELTVYDHDWVRGRSEDY